MRMVCKITKYLHSPTPSTTHTLHSRLSRTTSQCIGRVHCVGLLGCRDVCFPESSPGCLVILILCAFWLVVISSHTVVLGIFLCFGQTVAWQLPMFSVIIDLFFSISQNAAWLLFSSIDKNDGFSKCVQLSYHNLPPLCSIRWPTNLPITGCGYDLCVDLYLVEVSIKCLLLCITMYMASAWATPPKHCNTLECVLDKFSCHLLFGNQHIYVSLVIQKLYSVDIIDMLVGVGFAVWML
jgi:hypothetical protein